MLAQEARHSRITEVKRIANTFFIVMLLSSDNNYIIPEYGIKSKLHVGAKKQRRENPCAVGGIVYKPF
jgi:hypothetical protein